MMFGIMISKMVDRHLATHYIILWLVVRRQSGRLVCSVDGVLPGPL
jgi:hypothetical protein